MISVKEALGILRDSMTPLAPIRLPLHDALNSTLAEDLHAPEDQPRFDRAAMDGYAIVADETKSELEILETIHAGRNPTHALAPGFCSRIFTGAQVPENSGAVIPQEMIQKEGSRIVILSRPTQSHIRRKGEDIASGTLVLPRGTLLEPAKICIAASLGVSMPLVHPRPRAALFSTGDELVECDMQPGPGQIRNCNGPYLAAAVTASGGTIVQRSTLRDDRLLLLESLRHASSTGNDLLLISGGASVGDRDFTRSVLEELGFTLCFHRIALRPGQPLLYAKKGDVHAFGIPGNPVSHVVCFELFIRQALALLQNRKAEPGMSRKMLAAPFNEPASNRETYWPAFASGTTAKALPWMGSGDLASLASSNGFIRIPPNTGPCPAGSEIDFLCIGKQD